MYILVYYTVFLIFMKNVKVTLIIKWRKYIISDQTQKYHAHFMHWKRKPVTLYRPTLLQLT